MQVLMSPIYKHVLILKSKQPGCAAASSKVQQKQTDSTIAGKDPEVAEGDKYVPNLSYGKGSPSK